MTVVNVYSQSGGCGCNRTYADTGVPVQLEGLMSNAEWSRAVKDINGDQDQANQMCGCSCCCMIVGFICLLLFSLIIGLIIIIIAGIIQCAVRANDESEFLKNAKKVDREQFGGAMTIGRRNPVGDHHNSCWSEYFLCIDVDILRRHLGGPNAVDDGIAAAIKDTSGFDGRWLNNMKQEFVIKNGIVIMGDSRQAILDQGAYFQLENSFWKMNKGDSTVRWTDGHTTVTWKKVIANIQDFDGDWRNELDQEFTVKNGVIYSGNVQQKIIEDDTHFHLEKSVPTDQDWRLEKNCTDAVWTGPYGNSVKWFRKSVQNTNVNAPTAAYTISQTDKKQDDTLDAGLLPAYSDVIGIYEDSKPEPSAPGLPQGDEEAPVLHGFNISIEELN